MAAEHLISRIATGTDGCADIGELGVACEVLLTVQAARLSSCSGFLGYMDIFATVDWKDHRGRSSRLARTPTAWGSSTSAEFNHTCPPKKWQKPGGPYGVANNWEIGSMTFRLFQESFGGFGTPSLLGAATGLMTDFIGEGEIGEGCKKTVYVLDLEGKSVGTITVECHFSPAFAVRRKVLSRSASEPGAGDSISAMRSLKIGKQISVMRPLATLSKSTAGIVSASVSRSRSDPLVEKESSSSSSSDEDIDEDTKRKVEEEMEQLIQFRVFRMGDEVGVGHVPSASTTVSRFKKLVPTAVATAAVGPAASMKQVHSMGIASQLSEGVVTTASLRSPGLKLCESRRKKPEEMGELSPLRRGKVTSVAEDEEDEDEAVIGNTSTAPIIVGSGRRDFAEVRAPRRWSAHRVSGGIVLWTADPRCDPVQGQQKHDPGINFFPADGS